MFCSFFFQVSGKNQILLNLFVFFHIDFVVLWNRIFFSAVLTRIFICYFFYCYMIAYIYVWIQYIIIRRLECILTKWFYFFHWSLKDSIFWPGLNDSFVSQNLWEYYSFHLYGMILVCAYTIYPSRGVIVIYIYIYMCVCVCVYCNRYRGRKWSRRREFKSWTILSTFHIVRLSLEKVWIQLFSLQKCVNSTKTCFFKYITYSSVNFKIWLLISVQYRCIKDLLTFWEVSKQIFLRNWNNFY